MTLVWLGALLIVGGVLFTAAQPILRGRFSGGRPLRPVRPSVTLEPERPARGLGLSANWPGLAMIALGTVLLLAGAVF